MAVDIDADGTTAPPVTLDSGALADYLREREAEPGAAPRWVWSDTSSWYPSLLGAGARVGRCHDLRLCHAILKRSERVPETERAALAAAVEWDRSAEPVEASLGASLGLGSPSETGSAALFDLEAPARAPSLPDDIDAALAEFQRQRAAVSAIVDPPSPERSGRSGRSDRRDRRDRRGRSEQSKMALLLAAESAGALVAAEMTAAGLPWDAAEHDRILSEALGPRPSGDTKPAKLLSVAEEVRAALGNPGAGLDSPPKLLRALREAGIEVASTSHWELEEHDHPAIEPLLRYKKLSRLLSANGWAWIDDWVRDGRYRPVYVPGGVVTGRWASSGGGALQLPRMLRPAVRADPGWVLVSADVAQLEPRVLAAMSADRAMAAAGAGKDLYAGIVESGVVSTRQEAKIALLGAMYGATTGDSGRLVPQLRRGFAEAMRLVDEAAAVGERGGIVSTWLGRSSPPPGDAWVQVQGRASLPGATRADEDRARRAARDFGRFTRNFVVQGTAAEWALAWLAGVRAGLAGLNGSVSRRAELVFFLHDEIIVHAPTEGADEVAEIISESAEAAGRLLFGAASDGLQVEFPLDLRISERAEKG